MRKLQVLGAALAALFALAVLTASSASAAVSFLLAEWLVGGVGTTTTQLTDTEGELELHSLGEGLIGPTTILCSGIFDGSIGPNGADEITEALTLSGALVGPKELEGSAYECTNVSGCPEPLVWVDNLPWLTLAVLMVDGTEEFTVDLLKSASAAELGYHIVCFGFLEALCTTPEAITKLSNEANGTVDGLFEEKFTELAELHLAKCTVGGEAEVNGLGFILLTAGGTLAVSE